MTAIPSVSLIWILLLLRTTIGWIHPTWIGFEKKTAFRKDRILIFSESSSSNLNNDYAEIPNVIETDDPCWQNMLDDDCSMGNIYAANFVAGKWIKSMPCGQGIEDCDMPTGLSVPDARPEAGVDHVDVMKFLGLKRAEALKKQTGGGNTTQGGDNNNSNPSTSTASAP